ncbi:glyoxalase superfamily protein [Nocardioides sp. LHG3406-4]|uniref:glyoxalase superfamily protein n=1 Tax=Nocardioides sp. LHG3406-4 TaxID=2804575 RepID=UPI003CED0AA1
MDDLLEAVPILRIFDVQKAKDFYVGYLGFTLDWEHRFEPSLPLYAQVSRGAVRLHLSEHHGDGTPGTSILVAVGDARGLHAELRARDYDMLRPGLEHEEWGLVVTVTDPFGNSLRFHEATDGRETERLDPIRHEFVVAGTPEKAFERFTGRYGEWWDAQHTRDPETYEGMSVTPRVGGSVAHRHRDSSPHPIGEVTAWEPGEHFAQTFTLAIDPAHPTTLDVRFAPDPAGTRVTFEHGGWTAATAHARARFGDWPHLLARYTALD